MESIVKNNNFYDKSKAFALRIINLHNYLVNDKKEKAISNQIFRSGTSIGANVSESVFAASNKDFINKLQIAEKETCETAYWLELLFLSKYINNSEYESIYEQCRELIKLLTTIINSKKTKDNLEIDNNNK
jgi:four helix bundle protein